MRWCRGRWCATARSPAPSSRPPRCWCTASWATAATCRALRGGWCRASRSGRWALVGSCTLWGGQRCASEAWSLQSCPERIVLTYRWAWIVPNWTSAHGPAPPAAQFQVILVDLRCHGDSAPLSGALSKPHSVESAAADVLRLLSALKLFPEVGDGRDPRCALCAGRVCLLHLGCMLAAGQFARLEPSSQPVARNARPSSCCPSHLPPAGPDRPQLWRQVRAQRGAAVLCAGHPPAQARQGAEQLYIEWSRCWLRRSWVLCVGGGNRLCGRDSRLCELGSRCGLAAKNSAAAHGGSNHCPQPVLKAVR